MKKHPIITTLVLGTAATAGANYMINRLASNRHKLNNKNGRYYQWKDYSIFYKKQGSGLPMLLIHDIDYFSSGEEWKAIVNQLSKSFTVYTIDLLGCGRSDRPAMKYTPYFYSQLISDFIVDVIHKPTNIISSFQAGQTVLAVCKFHPELVMQTLLINPKNPMEKNNFLHTFRQYISYKILSLPIFGTACFNYKISRKNMYNELASRFYNPVPENYVDLCYETAHKDMSYGKYLFESISLGYMESNVDVSRETLDVPVSILYTSHNDSDYQARCERYKRLMPEATFYQLHHSIFYPQIEQPTRLLDIIEDVFM